MNPYYFIFEATPQSENPVIGHVSRSVAHIWVMATDIDAARANALDYLATNHWDVNEEKDATSLTQQAIDAMGEEEFSNYQTAQKDGIEAKFYYWHRSE